MGKVVALWIMALLSASCGLTTDEPIPLPTAGRALLAGQPYVLDITCPVYVEIQAEQWHIVDVTGYPTTGALGNGDPQRFRGTFRLTSTTSGTWTADSNGKTFQLVKGGDPNVGCF